MGVFKCKNKILGVALALTTLSLSLASLNTFAASCHTRLQNFSPPPASANSWAVNGDGVQYPAQTVIVANGILAGSLSGHAAPMPFEFLAPYSAFDRSELAINHLDAPPPYTTSENAVIGLGMNGENNYYLHSDHSAVPFTAVSKVVTGGGYRIIILVPEWPGSNGCPVCIYSYAQLFNAPNNNVKLRVTEQRFSQETDANYSTDCAGLFNEIG